MTMPPLKRRANYVEKFKMFMEMHWVKVAVVIFLICATSWPILAFRSIDSY